MNRQASKTIGITLLLAAGLLTILIAIAFSSSPGVGAHDCESAPTPSHADSRGEDCSNDGHSDSDHQAPRMVNTVDGGRDRDLVFYVSPHSVYAGSDYLDNGDQIEFKLPDEFDLDNASHSLLAQIEIASSNTSNNSITDLTSVAVDGNLLTLTLPELSSTLSPYEYLIITTSKGTGILTPEIPKGFDDSDEGYSVGITLIDTDVTPQKRIDAADENIVVVRNPVSSTVPSATVHVELATHTEDELKSGDEITVDFSGPSADSEFAVSASSVAKRN